MTPGVAGTATAMITATLVGQFGVPGNWTGLVLSLLFGLFVLGDKATPIMQRVLFYFVNSMIIFSVAIGINTAGIAATKSEQQAQYESRWVPPEGEAGGFFQQWF